MNQILGTTKILDNGPDSDRLNIVFLAEGYQDTEQTSFNDSCDEIVIAIQNEPWFGDLLKAVNIHRINVESNESGADDPDCDGDGAGTTADTFFDATFCADGVIRRLLVADATKAQDAMDDQVPEWHAGVVLVNTTTRGGAGGAIATASVHGGDWIDVILHELGHSLFGLADEYNYWAGCGTDTDRDNAPSGEPIEPNVTSNNSITGLKWGHLVDTLTTPIPTMENPDCSTCDTRPNVLPSVDIIGLYEGAKYYHCGRYRPAYNCKMRSSFVPFCRVCAEAIHDRVRPFFGSDPALGASVSELDFGDIGTGATRTLDFDISNLGTVDVTGINITIDNPNYLFSTVPAGSTLGSGNSATISVTLGPVFTVGSQPGSITITSNSDTITIGLIANVCTASPDLDTIPFDGDDLDFGDVTQGLTMYRSFEVQNRKTSCPGPLRVVLTDPVGNFSYAPGTVLDFVLPAAEEDEIYTSQTVFVAFTASTGGSGIESGSLTITTPDNTGISTVTLNLVGNVVPEKTIDTVLVIDRSGSMSDPTGEASNRKIDHAIYAGDLYVDLMKDIDRTGVIGFNTSTDELIGLTLAGSLGAGNRGTIKNVIDISNLNPTGGTSVGAGIIAASDLLDASTADDKAIIVLTDARQNVDPSIAEANVVVSGKSPQQRVFAVGLGLNQIEENLDLMASLTDGYTQITPDLVGSKEFLLQKLYVQILSDVEDSAFVKDPYRVLQGGNKQFTEIKISELETSVDFILCNRPSSVHPKYMRIWLEAPDGTILKQSDAASHPNLTWTQQEAHQIARLRLPFFPAKPQSHIGSWKVWVENFYTYEAVYSHYVENQPPRYPLYYSVMSKAKSNFLLRGNLIQDGYMPNTSFEFILDPTMHGLSIELDYNPIISIRKPNGNKKEVQLWLDADGVYRGTFTDTHAIGVYAAQTEVKATSPMGHSCTRFRYFTGIISRKPQNTIDDGQGGNNGQNDEMKRCCKEINHLLKKLIEKDC
ncbi:VWA domain-containing protein [Maribacter sp. ANRC-HE7]|uniref:VWA domain-containing protein n=1 Tax=Maribacter aquimaris TaxID=2737171 RepID=A0ABR7UZK5_9FLAO|nr:M64 family metallopeptidase [Maribacter aquimaris]MBD0776387.1 VWA domain-containing protein [Maribacter aquimaris]